MSTRSLRELGRGLPSYPVGLDGLGVGTDGGPTWFWERLRTLFRGAQKKISLATLYWGTDERELILLDELRSALARRPELTLQVVVDYCRGRRQTQNGNTMTFFGSLVAQFPGRVSVFLHRMPQIAGIVARLPSPLDECFGVFHFKSIAVDGEAILTGANLSDEYWHCRQARYFEVRDPSLVALCHQIVDSTAAHSIPVHYGPDGSVELGSSAHSPNVVHDVIRQQVEALSSGGSADTVVHPLVQHPAFGLRQEYDVLLNFLSWTAGDLEVHTPYPNFPQGYTEALERRLGSVASGRTVVVTPSVNSHSFTTGRGAKALVPAVYKHREDGFVARLGTVGRDPEHALEFHRYDRPSWVFHSKGVWLTTRDESATIIGSSSFGERSVCRDFDMSFLVVTRDAGMRRAIAGEIQVMHEHTVRAGSEHAARSRLAPVFARCLRTYL